MQRRKRPPGIFAAFPRRKKQQKTNKILCKTFFHLLQANAIQAVAINAFFKMNCVDTPVKPNAFAYA